MRNLSFELRKFRLLKGSSLPTARSLLRVMVTSPMTSFSTISQKLLRKISGSLNSMAKSQEFSLVTDLSWMATLGSMAMTALQCSELTRKRICFIFEKQMRQMFTFSLLSMKTFWSVCMTPFMHRRPLICSSISIFMCKCIYFRLFLAHLGQQLEPLRFRAEQTFIHLFGESIHWLEQLICGQINLSMSRDKSPPTSFEKMFTTQEIFRRNKHYYDALKISELQRNDQKRRRKPKLQAKDHSHKVDHSFQSAKKEREVQVGSEIQKFKFRMSFYSTQDGNPENGSQSSRYKQAEEANISPQKIKAGVSHEKLLSRQSLNKLRNKPIIDERQFNNFYITTNDLSKTPQIGKYSPRNNNIALEHMTDLNYNSQKKYEQVYFDNRTNSCIFDLKKQKDSKERYFFIPQRQQNLASTDMQPQKVAKSFSAASHFKPNKILNFYRINGRELPCQLDQRHLSPNKHFYKDQDGKLLKPQMSFTARRYKDELLARDLSDLKAAKTPYFTRNQVCDQIFFKQERRKRENK